MNQQTLSTYTQNPALITAGACAELQKLTERYPYFHAANVLFLKGLKNANSVNFNEELIKRSVFLGNKRVFEDFLAKEFLADASMLRQVQQPSSATDTSTSSATDTSTGSIGSTGSPTASSATEEELTFENEIIPYKIPETLKISITTVEETPVDTSTGSATDTSMLRQAQQPSSVADASTGLTNEQQTNFEDEIISFELHEMPQTAVEAVVETAPKTEEEIISFEIVDEIAEETVEETVEEMAEETVEATKENIIDTKNKEEQPLNSEVAEQKNETPAQPEKPLSLAETILLRVQQMKNNETQSFSGTKITDTSTSSVTEKLQPQNVQQTIIDKFLAHDAPPQVVVENVSDNQYDKSERSVQEGEYVTETMAKIYVQQKKNDKAIKIYEQLALQFPQKSVYFAQKISEIQQN